MKKFLYLASAATLALASCSDDLGIKAPGSDAAAGDGAITATYTVGGEETETRTTLYNYTYLWNLGDQIGVLGAIKELNVVNEPFVYNSLESAAKGNFKGDVTLLPYEGYVGYYPWTATDKLGLNYNSSTDDGTEFAQFTLSNSYVQNFNATAAATSWNSNRANGSFGNNAAPAIAYATANAQGQVSFTFEPVASYLVFPITATEDVTITSVTLSLGGEVYLVQDCNITVKGYNVTYNWSQGKAANLPADIDGTSIQLLVSGNGVEVGPTNGPTNFWFVVPANVQLAGNTVSLEVALKGQDDTVTLTRTLGEDWVDSTKKSKTTVANNTVWMMNEIGKYFTIDTGDTYNITTPAQFLEYAYVTYTGINALYPDWSKLINYSMTDLPNMLTGANYDGNLAAYYASTEGKPENTLYGLTLKPAVISGTLDVSPEAVAKYIAQQSMTDLVKQGSYYKKVYVPYVYNSTPLPTIGGQASYTIGGTEDSPAILTGLTSANSVFTTAANGSPAGTVQYLTLQNCSVVTENPSSETYTSFLTPGGGAKYIDLTIGEGCNVNGETSADKNVGVFTSLNNQWFGATAVNNEVFDIYAQTLNITKAQVELFNNYAFDFSMYKGAGPQNFLSIVKNVTAAPKTAVMVVSGRTQAGYLVQDGKVTVSDGTAYAVISMAEDGETPAVSYWTGSTYGGKIQGLATAEYLYSLVNASSDGIFDMNINLDLMASYANTDKETENKYWYIPSTNSAYTLTVNTSETGNTISNVYMNGYNRYQQVNQESYTPTNILTVLGFSSIVPELLYLNNVYIDVPAGTTNNLVAAVSAVPGTGSEVSNVSVNQMKVTPLGTVQNTVSNNNVVTQQPTFQNEAVGGLYSFLNINNFAYVGPDCSYSNTPGNINVKAGVIAGYLNLKNLGNNVKLTLPYIPRGGQQFGQADIVLTSSGNASCYLQITCNSASDISKISASYMPEWLNISSSSNQTLYMNVNGGSWLQKNGGKWYDFPGETPGVPSTPPPTIVPAAI